MSRYEIINDTMFAGVSAEDAQSEDITAKMTEIADSYVRKQYRGFQKPLSVEMSPVDWTLTDDPEVAAAFELSHACENCEGGKRKAVEYLLNNSGRFLIMANLRYVEEWPN